MKDFNQELRKTAKQANMTRATIRFIKESFTCKKSLGMNGPTAICAKIPPLDPMHARFLVGS